MPLPEIGAEATIRRIVEVHHTADEMGNPGARVLATPILGLFFEHAATQLLTSRLDEGMGTLGVKLVVNHLAPTPVGMEVEVTARVVDVQGRRLAFAVEARDEVEVIGHGEHDRVVVDWERFLSSASEKASERASE